MLVCCLAETNIQLPGILLIHLSFSSFKGIFSRMRGLRSSSSLGTNVKISILLKTIMTGLFAQPISASVLSTTSICSSNEEPVVLWRRLEPFWNAVKNTGYGQAFRITVNELYGIEKIEESVIPQFQQAFEKLTVRRKPNCCRITFSGFVSNWPMNIIYRSNSIWDIMPEVIGCLFPVSRKMLHRLSIYVLSPPKPGLCLCTRRIPTVTI